MFKLVKILTLTLLISGVLVDAKFSFSSLFKKKKQVVKEHVLTVVSVADGDTITVKNQTSKSYTRVRFLCIDAPEKSQVKWGSISSARLKQLLPINSTVKLIGSKKDLYNRTLAEVVNMNGTLTNLKMMEEGLVAFYPYQKGCKVYRTAEAKAKKAKKGIWSDKTFIKPWDYRKKAGIGYRGGAFDKKNKTSKYNKGGVVSTTRKYNKDGVVLTTRTVPRTSKMNIVLETTTLRRSERLADKTKQTTVMSYRDALKSKSD